MCLVSDVMCQMSHITWQVLLKYIYIYKFFLDKVVILVGGVSVIKRAYPIYFVFLQGKTSDIIIKFL